MENFLFYIGKSALAAGAFYLVYLALFQNQKQFTFNRIYLPVSLALSFVIPLISFTTVNYVEPVTVESNPLPVFAESFEPVVMQQSQPQFIWELYHYLFAVYAAGTAFFLFRLLLGHGKAWNIIRKSRVQELFNNLVNISKKDIHPFSFFSKIVLSENTLSHPNLKIIVEHEKIHVKEKHTLDILFTEILFLLQWFNPFAWLLKDAVKNNLEYKTDHEIAKTTDAQTYQLAMVALADKQGVVPFLTALNGSQLKNRIIMMKRKTGNKYAWLKQLVVLPLVAVLVMGLSNRELKMEIKHQNEITAAHLEIQKEAAVYDHTTDSNNEHLEDKIISKKDQQIEPISDSKDNYKIQPDNESETMILSENVYVTQEPDTNVSKKTDKRFSLDNRLYIIDGKEYKGDINDIDVNDIESIDILKDASATVFYGERGKHGVILITTISKSDQYLDDNAQNVRPLPKEEVRLTEERPEFPGGKEALKQYIANNINYPESAKENGIQGRVYVTFKITKEGNVTDAKVARGIYPALDEEAVRVVSSLPNWKPGKQNGQPVEVVGYAIPVDFELKDYTPKVQSVASSIVVPGTLYIVDGKETTSIKDIPPGDIEKFDVLNRASSTAIYGQKGKDGVIVITTKKNIITSELELRQFIAKNIRYPVEAQRIGLHGITSTVIDPGKSNRIVSGENYTRKKVYNLPRVVVVGYGGNEVPSFDPEKDIPLLFKEVERVRQMLPKIDIPGLEGKLIGISVEFELQPER